MLSKDLTKLVIELLESKEALKSFLQNRDSYLEKSLHNITVQERNVLETLNEEELKFFFRSIEACNFKIHSLPTMEAVLIKASQDPEFLKEFLARRSGLLIESGIMLSPEEAKLYDSIPKEVFLLGLNRVFEKSSNFGWDKKIPLLGLAIMLAASGLSVWQSSVRSFGLQPDYNFQQKNNNRKLF